MSREHVISFMLRLKNVPELNREALELKNIYPPDSLPDAFIALARREGFIFSLREYIEYVYMNGDPEKSTEK